jgi:hypothetical protein
MNTRDNKRSPIAAMVAALAFGIAGGAFAQSAASGTGDADEAGIPQIQQQGDVTFVSGGVGSDEASALRRAQHEWPLVMRFTGPGSEYLADVHVRIVGAHAGEILNTDSRGPYMLVRLPPGRYTIHATYNGNDQRKAVTVPERGSVRADFYWSSL